MSRIINDNLPFTDEEKAWLVKDDLSTNRARVALNERRFGHLSEEEKEAMREQFASDSNADRDAAKRRQEAEDAEFHPDDVAQVAPLSMAELREAIEKRNETPEGETVEDLQLQLLEILDAQRNAV